MKTAAAYARVSTIAQSGLSLDGQFDAINSYARLQGITITDYYRDKESGKTDSREEFDVMLDRARKGAYEMILCEKLDRFSRSGVTGAALVDKLERDLGIEIIAVLEPMDGTTPLGRAMRAIRFVLGGLEREEIVERTKRRMKDIAKRGYYMGGYVPLGYKLEEVRDEENRKRYRYAIDSEKAETILAIYTRYAAGKSLVEIQTWLHGIGFNSNRGTLISKIAIRDILNNERYTGKYIYGLGTKKNTRIKRKDAIRTELMPQIIPRELYEQVHTRFGSRKYAPSVHRYLLRKILYCGECGKAMQGGGGRTVIYICRKHSPHLTISKRKVENFVVAYLQTEVLADVNYGAVTAELNRLESQNDNRKKAILEELKFKRQKSEEEKRRIIEAIKSGVAIEILKEELQKLEAAENLLTVKLQTTEIPSVYVTEDEVRIRYAALQERLSSGDDDTLEALLYELIARVDVYRTGYIKIAPK